jgi:hypothetical protein
MRSDWSASRPGRFIPGERVPVYIGYKAVDGTQNRYRPCGEISCPPVRPLARRYTG